MTAPILRIGTRGSRLALAQANQVADRLQAAHPQLIIKVILIQTTGDRILDSPLSRIGGKGVFTKEIEEALLDGRIDIAVHSLKDLPTQQPAGLALGAISERESPVDILITREPMTYATLREGMRIGTSSLRRRAQLAWQHPTVFVEELRGNVPTRIDKLNTGLYDGILLAAAGVNRLGIVPPHKVQLQSEEMLPAPAQGALGIQIRDGDTATHQMLTTLHHEESARCCIAERALLQALGGGCQLPLGTLATIENGRLHLRGRVVSLDGKACAEGSLLANPAQPEAAGKLLAEELLAKGADQILKALLNDVADGFLAAVTRAQEMDKLPLGGWRVVVTRDEDADGPLSQALRDLGAHPQVLPLVRHLPPEDPAPLRECLAALDRFDWLVITSSRAVQSLLSEGTALSEFKGRIACVGNATAESVQDAGGTVHLVPKEFIATALAQELIAAGVGTGTRVLYPRADLAADTLRNLLTEAGAEVADPIAYRTIKAGHTNILREVLLQRKPEAILFASPSAVEAAQEQLGHAELVPLLKGVFIGSIGPRTSNAVRAVGLDVHFEPEDRSFPGFAAGLSQFVKDRATFSSTGHSPTDTP